MQGQVFLIDQEFWGSVSFKVGWKKHLNLVLIFILKIALKIAWIADQWTHLILYFIFFLLFELNALERPKYRM